MTISKSAPETPCAYQQLNLFGTGFNSLSDSHGLTHKKSKMRIIVEYQCSTQRAAELMQVSPSTLSHAKCKGKLPYKHGSWSAELSGKLGKKYQRLSWKVTFNK